MALSMSRMLAPIIFLSVSACQLQPDIKQLQNENQKLDADLQKARANIEQLHIQERQLQAQLAELSRVNAVLDTEKMSRVQESSQLRSQVRSFVQHQIDVYKEFLVRGGLLDYIGGELVERSHAEGEPWLLLDLANPLPGAGRLTGVGGYFVHAGKFTVKVLRPVDNKLVVIWESQPLQVTQSGIQQIPFTVSVVVEKGDVIAYQLDQEISVAFDEGTGDTRFRKESLGLGQTVSASAFGGEKRRRTYSLGVYGLLN